MPRPKFRDSQLQQQIARRVRQARLKHGWTQEQMAEALDVASETVSRYEGGRVPLSVTMLYRVADVLDVRIETLLGRGAAGLAPREAELVEGWRMLDSDGQRLVMEMVRYSNRSSHRPKLGKKPGSISVHASP